ncbi:hypothetical protein BGZ76_006164 [Entomortierella beljakovae]|nr:hypothetical protein BGZ76_006164 [Entomortierella beljakovae]
MSLNIWLAASDGDLNAVKSFIEEKGVSIDAQDDFGYSALHAAASYGHKDLITYLLGKGANVNIQDPDGDTPLFVCETFEIAKMLIDGGANATHTNENEMTAADNAEEEAWLEVAHYLRELTGVPHPDSDVEDLEEDMSHLMEGDSDDEGERNENGQQNGGDSFKQKIDAIMKATEADGINRDDELKAAITEMLVAAGPGSTAQLSKELQDLVDKENN